MKKKSYKDVGFWRGELWFSGYCEWWWGWRRINGEWRNEEIR